MEQNLTEAEFASLQQQVKIAVSMRGPDQNRFFATAPQIVSLITMGMEMSEALEVTKSAATVYIANMRQFRTAWMRRKAAMSELTEIAERQFCSCPHCLGHSGSPLKTANLR